LINAFEGKLTVGEGLVSHTIPFAIKVTVSAFVILNPETAMLVAYGVTSRVVTVGRTAEGIVSEILVLVQLNKINDITKIKRVSRNFILSD